MKTYLELINLKTFDERFDYLKLDGVVCEETFGFQRWANQELYRSNLWKKIKDKIIIRDAGCDLGVPGYEIYSGILIHHINPITYDDIINNRPIVYDLNNLICTTKKTHNALHYSSRESLTLYKLPEERKANDTCPWKLKN